MRVAQNRIRANIIYLLSAEVMTKIVLFMVTVAISRYLGVAGFGLFSFSISFALIFGFIVDWGFTPLSIREIARDKNLLSKFIGNIILLKIMLSIIMMVLIFAVSSFLGKTAEVKYLIVLAALYVMFNSFNELLRGVFHSFGVMKYDALMRIIEKVILAVAVMFAIYKGKGIGDIVMSHTVASFLIMLFTIAIIWKYFGHFRIEFEPIFCKNALSQSLPFFFTAAFAVIYFKIDSVMLSFMKGNEEVGWYNAAYNIIIAFMVLPAILSKVIYPRLSEDYFQSREAYRMLIRRSLLFSVAIGIVAVIGISSFAHLMIFLLYGGAYNRAVDPLQILSFTFMLISINTVIVTALNASNRQKAVAVITGAGVVVNIVLNIILIPSYSINGAAIATFLTQGFYSLVLFIVFFKGNLKVGSNQ